MNLILIINVAFLLIAKTTNKISAEDYAQENKSDANHTFLPYTLNSQGKKESREGLYKHFLILNKEDEGNQNVPVEEQKIGRHGEYLDLKDNLQPYTNNWKRLSTYGNPYSAFPHKQSSGGGAYNDNVWNLFAHHISQNSNSLTGPANFVMGHTILLTIHLAVLSFILSGIVTLLSRVLTLGDSLKPLLLLTSNGAGLVYK